MLGCKGLSKTKLVDFSRLSIENCLNFNIYFLWFQQTKQAMIQALVKQNSNARTRIEKQKHEVSYQSSSIFKRHQLWSFRHQVARRASTRYLYSDAPYRAGNTPITGQIVEFYPWNTPLPDGFGTSAVRHLGNAFWFVMVQGSGSYFPSLILHPG